MIAEMPYAKSKAPGLPDKIDVACKGERKKTLTARQNKIAPWVILLKRGPRDFQRSDG